MYQLLINCLKILKCIYDYEYETGIEFKCIDKEFKPEEYEIFKSLILPFIFNNDVFDRNILYIEHLEQKDSFINQYIDEIIIENDMYESNYNKMVENLIFIHKLLQQDGINSKQKARDMIATILEEVKKNEK